MNRILKAAAIAVGTVLVLAVAASLLVSMLVDEQQLKTTLLERVNSRLNGALQINGEFKVSLWPSLSLKAKDMHLQTPAGAAEDFASAREIRIGVALLPLLRQEVRASELVFDGMIVRAERDNRGKGNWESLLKSVGEQAVLKPGDVTVGEAATVAVGAPLFLHVDKVRVDDATLSFHDRGANTHYLVDKLNLHSNGVNMSGDPFRIKSSARARSGEAGKTVDITLDSSVAQNAETGELTLSDTVLDVSPLLGHAIKLTAKSGSVSPRASNAELPAFNLVFDKYVADGAMAVNWSNPQALVASGTLAMQQFDAAQLLKALAIEAPQGINPAVLGQVSFNGAYKLRGDELMLSDLKLQAGRFNGELDVRLDLQKSAATHASLQSPDIDIDYLFPPDPATQAENPDAESSPLAGLLQLEGNFEASIGRLHNAAWDIGNVSAKLALQKNHARLERLTATLYGGTLSADGSVDARQDPGTLQANMRMTGVDLKPLLTAAQKIENLDGRVDTSVELRATGLNAKQWMATLNGPITVHIDKPVLHDISLEEMVCRSAAKLNNDKPTTRFPQFTQFGSMESALDFSNGVGTFSSLSALMPNIRLDGKGEVSLPARKLKIKLYARIIQDLGTLDNACRTPRKMMKLVWPITCKGSFDDEPAKLCGISSDDMANLATQLATDKLQDKLFKGLGKLFGSDKN